MWTASAFGRTLYMTAIGLFVFSIIVYFSIGSVPTGIFPFVQMGALYLIEGLGAAIALLFFSFFSNAWLKYFGQYFELEPDSIKIVQGILEQKESFIPYRSITNVSIKITVAEQVWGLADIMIFTSSPGEKENPSEAEGFISGLKYDDAVAMKDELLKKINPKS